MERLSKLVVFLTAMVVESKPMVAKAVVVVTTVVVIGLSKVDVLLLVVVEVDMVIDDKYSISRNVITGLVS